ncbi:MAG: MarR family EPS-associated transcriptional regulator [Candidatus Omnitrophota bacterium]
MPERPESKEANLIIIKEIESQPAVTQRELSNKLDISLGKINYLLKELIKNGFVEVKSFSDNPSKLNKIHYFITKEGLEYKVSITRQFLKEKEEEYNQIKRDWEQLAHKDYGFVNQGQK